MNASLEVAVAGKDRGTDEIALLDRLFDRGVERAAVADTGGAAVADRFKTEFVEFGLESGGLEVVGHDTRARPEGGLHKGSDGEAFFVGLLRDEPGREHHTRVRGVRAARDRGDEDAAVPEPGIDIDGGDRFPGDERIFELPGGRVKVERDRNTAIGGIESESSRTGGRGVELVEFAPQFGHIDAVLRTLRSGDGGHDRGKVEFEQVGVVALVFVGDPEEILRLVVVLHRGAELFGSAGAAEVIDRLAIHGEEAHRGAVLGSHVRDRGTVRKRKSGRSGAEELDKLADDPVGAEDLGDTEGEVGRGDALGESAVEVNADNFGHEESDRLSEHAGLGLDPADAPTDDAEAVDHGRVRIGPDESVRIKDSVFGKDPFGEVLEVHLVHDPDARRYHGESLEGLLTPFEEFITLAVANELDRHVAVEGGLRTGEIDLDRVVHDEVDRHEWLDPGGGGSTGDSGVTHRGDVDEERHACEVLQNDTRNGKRDLVFTRRLGIPVCEIFDIDLADLASVDVTQH